MVSHRCEGFSGCEGLRIGLALQKLCCALVWPRPVTWSMCDESWPQVSGLHGRKIARNRIPKHGLILGQEILEVPMQGLLALSCSRFRVAPVT